MAIDIKIPEFSESISEGTIGTWIKNVGDNVVEGETVVEVETDKVVLEIPAPVSGVISSVIKSENETVNSLEVIGHINQQQAAIAIETKSSDQSSRKESAQESSENAESQSLEDSFQQEISNKQIKKTSPAVRKLMHESNVGLESIHPSGKNNRVTKDDVLRASNVIAEQVTTQIQTTESSTPANQVERVAMSSLRKQISKRLVSAQQEYAMLTTFNEVNMHQIMDVRANNKDAFLDKHGVKLGFMSFFVLAAVEALKAYPIMNASVESDDIIYHQYIDVGVAVSTERGLVVPVIRSADVKSLSAIEIEINELAEKARNNKLGIDDLVGGTFTITNGGVFGSMLSTPIINPPQSAILGMHAIEKRPIVIGDEIKIAPMMYLALSYDHRIVDGREAVLFLSHIKNIIENPIQLLLHL